VEKKTKKKKKSKKKKKDENVEVGVKKVNKT